MKSGRNLSVFDFIAFNQTVYTLGSDTKSLVNHGSPVPSHKQKKKWRWQQATRREQESCLVSRKSW